MPVSLVTPSTRPATSSPNVLADLLQRGRRVLDRVVQQRGAQRLGVEPHARADLRHADRVDDEVLAGAAPLVGVVLAGEHERLDDALAVDRLGDLVGVLLDDREQVGEQLALDRREVGRDLGASAPGGCSATVDRTVRRRRRRSGRPRATPPAIGGARRRLLEELRPLAAWSCRWSGIGVRPRAFDGRPGRPASARARCAPALDRASGPALRDRGPTRSSSERTRTRRPASAADRGCGPSPRSTASRASPRPSPGPRSAR